MLLSLADLRREYVQAGLDEADLHKDPLLQFQKWFQQCFDAGVLEPNAGVLATATLSGRTSARTCLLKGVDARGFAFFTNYGSRKGRELAENPQATFVFPWLALERQVIVSGTVTKLEREESEAYFKVRPRGSRLGAWASHQSAVIPNRGELEERLRQLELLYPGNDIPIPANWGGYLLTPDEIEFWQGRANRLHDRLQYMKSSQGEWRIQRLSP
jgi:pyridoxamine 5'-phosphate oxidase